MLVGETKAVGKEALCKVCGDRASGKHYGVSSCDGCRGFFKRSIRRDLQYVCKEGGKCTIDVMRRNQCQACRFGKCLLVNMRREAVQHERAPRTAGQPCNLVSIPFDFYTQQKAIPMCSANVFLPLHGTMSSDFVYKTVDSHFPEAHAAFQYHDTNLLSANYQKRQFLSLFESNCNQNSNKVDERTYQRFKDPPIAKSSPADVIKADHEINNKEFVFESAAKLLYFAVKWVRSIPHYNQLPAIDQAVLLESSWAEIFIVMAAQWGLPLESLSPSKDIENIQRVIEQFKVLKVDVAEASCLKALILFKPILVNAISLEYVNLVKDQSIGYLTEKCGALRLGHLLLLLPFIKTAANPKNVQDTFFKGTVGEVAIERLLGDLI